MVVRVISQIQYFRKKERIYHKNTQKRELEETKSRERRVKEKDLEKG